MIRSNIARLLAIATLTASASTASAASYLLAGSQWGYPLNVDADVSDRRSVRFAVDGKLFGNGGCNRFRGSYHQNGSTITISPLATTRKACEEEVMALERKFMLVLTSARSVEATQFKLVILDADGAVLLRMVRQDWD